MITVFEGNVNSKKSENALNFTADLEGKKYYLATLKTDLDGVSERIERQRAKREGKDFVTIEQESTIIKAIDKIKWMESLLNEDNKRRVALIESLPILSANEIALEDAGAKDIVNKILFGLAFLKEFFDDIVIVTDDNPDISYYGKGVITEDKKQLYEEVMKELNASVYSYASEIYH